MNNSVLVTGGSGFVGKVLCECLNPEQTVLVGRTRPEKANRFFNIPLSINSDYAQALAGIEVVVHVAARTHIISDDALDLLNEYRAVNTEGTLNLARQAAYKGVKRFIFVSSIKVNGETTSGRQPFTEQMLSAPQDPYGISKMEAEDQLRIISSETGMEVVIIRPPLVYGANVKANFLSLIKLSDSPIPLPFGAFNNKRSMVYVGNLVDFIVKCIEHPAAGNQTFLISDGDDLSLKELLGMMRTALGRPVRLFSIPTVLFRIAGNLMGQSAVSRRLVGDLQVDSSKASKLLKWNPPFTVKQGIKATIAAYSEGKK